MAACPFRRGRKIWISSGLRSLASGLREFPGFRRLDSFGIPWILSSEMSFFNGLRATLGPFLFLGGPFPGGSVERAARFGPKVAGAEASRRRQRPDKRRIMAVDIEKIVIGQWDQTNAAFPFWQGNVDSLSFHAKKCGRAWSWCARSIDP